MRSVTPSTGTFRKSRDSFLPLSTALRRTDLVVPDPNHWLSDELPPLFHVPGPGSMIKFWLVWRHRAIG